MERLKNLLKNDSGAAFIMVLAATMVLYITAATFTVMITNQTKAIRADRNKQKAFYMAEAGLNQALIKAVRYPRKTNTNLNIGIPVPIKFYAEDGVTEVGEYQVKFEGVNKDGVVDPADNLSDVKKITSTGVIKDTSGGSIVNIESVQSEYTQSPFNRDIWATGGVEFKSTVPTTIACLTDWFYSAEVRWNIFGNLYSASQPRDDWRKQCCGYEIGCGTCVGFWLFGVCIGYLCECDAGETGCCVGWRQDMGARYKTNQQLCDKYGGGDCCNKWEDGKCTGYGGGTCCPNQTAPIPPPNKYYWDWEGVEAPTPFPQFVTPADPRIPGSSSNLEYITGSVAATYLKDNHYLSNVWVDGDVTINKSWLEGLLADGIGIYGTVFINGSLNYQYDSGAWLTAVCLVTDSNDPGTLIINEGDLHLWSAGSPNFGRVNIVLVNGDLTLESRCGIMTKGIYYAGGHTVDPTTKKRIGGTIKIKGAQASDVHILCDVIGDAVQGITGMELQSYSEIYGATIGKDIKFEGATVCNVITNKPFTPSTLGNCPPYGNQTYGMTGGNENLRIPEGFWSTVRVYNWREEK